MHIPTNNVNLQMMLPPAHPNIHRTPEQADHLHLCSISAQFCQMLEVQADKLAGD